MSTRQQVIIATDNINCLGESNIFTSSYIHTYGVSIRQDNTRCLPGLNTASEWVADNNSLIRIPSLDSLTTQGSALTSLASTVSTMLLVHS